MEGQAAKVEVSLYVREQLKCMEVCVDMDEQSAKSLWVKTKWKIEIGDITAGVYYESPDRIKQADEALY